MAVHAQAPAPEPDQDLLAAAREVAALFRGHPFVPRTWVEVQRFVAAVARADAPAAAPGADQPYVWGNAQPILAVGGGTVASTFADGIEIDCTWDNQTFPAPVVLADRRSS